MKKFILVFAAVAALVMSCQPVEEKADSLSGEGYKFNFTIAPGGFDTATKGDATVGWTAGEKVYVFFKPEGGELLGDSYAEFTYTDSGWNPESYVAPGALGASGKMAAVYVPYFEGKSPVYADNKWTFDSGDVYYSCASGADYTVNGGTVRGTLSMKIPDGYVQFSIASAAEGDELACNIIDGYEDVTLSSDLVFSTTPVSGNKMTGHADNGKIYFWGRVNDATATECEFTLTTSAGDVVLKVPAENVFKNNAFNIASTFEPVAPAGALPGVFSVGAGKNVQFSNGNLYWDGDSFEFEANQYDFQSSWSESHVSHFFWSKTASVAYAASYSFGSVAASDVFFTNAEAETAKADFTVSGVTGKYRTLSNAEWEYLLNIRTVNGGTGEGKSYSFNITYGDIMGVVLYPDNYTGSVLSGTVESLPEGVVFLPTAGYRNYSDIFSIEIAGYCWSSCASDIDKAYGVVFSSSFINPASGSNSYYGSCVRLVTDVASSAVPVASVSLNKTATTIEAGATETLTATVLPETATDKSVTWSSSKESVATVDNTGKVTAVAAGEATITVTTTDGSKTATCTVTVTAALPAGALKGVFSVSATKQVYFSQGNLYYDGNALNFEANQYATASSWDASHVSHFTWSSTAEAAVGDSNSGENLFCDENNKVSVNGSEAIYYALSEDEWKYLFSNHSKKWVTVNGVNGYVIAPDDFTGTLADTYADDAALAADNLVFLPAAGSRLGSDVYDVGGSGLYWSSTAYDEYGAYDVFFNSYNVNPGNFDYRTTGCSVRLVTDK